MAALVPPNSGPIALSVGRDGTVPVWLPGEIAIRDSMVYLEGADYTGPGLRTESRGQLMLTYLTDIRGERIVVIQVTWFGWCCRSEVRIPSMGRNSGG